VRADERGGATPPPADRPPPDRPPADPSEPEPDRPDRPDQTMPVAEALGLTPPSEVARAALNRAKAAARARGSAPGRPVPRRASGAGTARPDGRDPVLIGDALSRIATERGWQEELSVGGVVGRWPEVVGADVSEHCTPETFEDGLLVVRADSTTWAANLRLLTPQLLARLEAEVGPGVVREVSVLGPSGPRWVRGRRSVPGRGPRDTYG
jgi:predicted nucleic acid-binding Zn ribbon protein